ncbi:MAG: O-antigen ligase family protein [candidate division Zixibacteria bacterium]|nr:O-antigen ligase family protein [candidate division Zixibacteria bacterium]
MNAIPERFQAANVKPDDLRGKLTPPGLRLPAKALFICFSLFLFSSAFSIAAAQISLALCLISSLWLAAELRTRSQISLRPIFLIWGVYLTWLIVSSLANDDSLRSLSTIREEWLIVILPIGVFLHRREDSSRRLILTLACGLLLASSYGIVQHFSGWTVSAGQKLHVAGDYWRISGNFSHPLTYGYYVVTATVFLLTYLILSYRSFSRQGRALLVAAAGGGLVASALCNSRGPMLALAVGLIAAGLLLGKWRWVVSVMAGIGLLLLVLSPNLPRVFSERVQNDLTMDNPAGRLFIWKKSLEIVEESPVFGCGPGNFPAAYARQLGADSTSGSQGHAHNDFLHQAASGGIPALGLYLLFWTAVIGRLWQIHRRAGSATAAFALSTGALVASAAFLTGSMTECAIADEELRQVLFAVWAAGLSQSGQAADNPST